MRSRLALVLGLALALGHVAAPASALASAWADGSAPSHADSYYDAGLDSYNTTNVIACQELAESSAKLRGLAVDTKVEQHRYPNGHICSKVVATYSNGRTCECYSAHNVVCK